ncbi:phenylalanine--tRNA ligase subunit alpha [Candidatus Woesearchaeota archaeon]|nr:phenylalanine--tRNA ligase subunit alpha [Candidatus Woesearchaeota archaeon]
MVSMEDVIAGLHRLERAVLPALLKHSSVYDIGSAAGLKEVEVLRGIRWLRDKKLADVKEAEVDFVELDELGRAYAREGLPEVRFLEALKAGKLGLDSLMQKAKLSRDEVNASIGLLKRNGWISINKGLVFEITVQGRDKLSKGFDEYHLLRGRFPLKVEDVAAASLDNLVSRRILRISKKKLVTAALTALGRKIASSSALKEDAVDRLTPEMIKSGSWSKLRSYNLEAPVPKVFLGKKQPYRRFLEEVRSRLVALGFREMSGPVVESEFWNMDALFMPQFHSARDIHDVYYVKEPKFADNLPKKIVENVRRAHERGIPGSRGWRYKFDYKKTARLVLRSQDTSISPRTLSSEDLQIPGKYFQIARCFRYDVIDATHNADFDQIGGFVVGEQLNLRHLFGLLRLFAREFCGTDEVKVVPSYFPFTEPSAALYAKHPALGWIELAGAGIFRPEMTVPLGVDKPVIAWGIGLGRVAMFKLGLKDIRQLYSHDLEYLRAAKV